MSRPHRPSQTAASPSADTRKDGASTRNLVFLLATATMLGLWITFLLVLAGISSS